MKVFFKWMFLIFLPAILAVIFDLMGDPDMGLVIVILLIPYSGVVIYKLYKYVKELDDYNNKRL